MKPALTINNTLNLLKALFIFFGFFVFQINVITVSASTVNLGFDPRYRKFATCGMKKE